MAGSRRTILILEDNVDQVRIFQKHLEQEGHAVVVFYDSKEALAWIRDQTPDLILLDIMLGTFDEGYEICRILKSDPHTQDVPVIMLTARVEVADKVRGLELGADDYIVKPVDLDELSARVHATFRVKKRHEVLVEMNQKLRSMSITDELTGLYNRRHFDERLSMEVESAHRYHHTLSCLMIDLDHFKQINDTYGHAVGDQVLCEIARIFEQQTRVVDLVARYGGEEFVILLPQTDAKGAYVLAERIRSRVMEHAFCEPMNLAITVSIGCASFDDDGLTNAVHLVKRADEALYEAKRTRNQVVLHS